MAELLLELMSEEIPARMQTKAAADLKLRVCEELKEARLDYDNAQSFVTPRRLTLTVDGLPASQPDISIERKGPKVVDSRLDSIHKSERQQTQHNIAETYYPASDMRAGEITWPVPNKTHLPHAPQNCPSKYTTRTNKKNNTNKM